LNKERIFSIIRSCGKGLEIFRIGQGYDAHRLEPDTPLVLGGVEIPHDKGLVGHSDADALVHAVMDALLGAAAMGDIGTHFPDTDPQWRGASSIGMLKKVIAMLAEEGWVVNNIDCTVVAQEPKLAPYISQMRESMAKTISMDVGQISIKAKTTEGMGFTGDGTGMEAYAIASISETLPDKSE